MSVLALIAAHAAGTPEELAAEVTAACLSSASEATIQLPALLELTLPVVVRQPACSLEHLTLEAAPGVEEAVLRMVGPGSLLVQVERVSITLRDLALEGPPRAGRRIPCVRVVRARGSSVWSSPAARGR